MKKMIIGVIIGIIATIAIGSGAIIIYAKFFMVVPDKDGMINENINDEVLERNLLGGTQIEFEDNQILAIGYVTDASLNKFIEKNFVTKEVFERLITLDYRKEESRINGSGITFVFIPKTSDVEIEIYDCYITENGEAKIVDQWGETLNEGFVLLQEYMAETTIPELCAKVKYHGVEEIIPLVFSGEDGKLDLTKNKKIVQDISVY